MKQEHGDNMPKLPSPEELGTVGPQAGGSIAILSPGTVGGVSDQGEVFGALGEAGESVVNQAIEEQKEMNNTAVQDAINQYNEKRSELELEQMQVKGKDAANKQFVETSLAKLDSISTGIRSGLRNDAQVKKWDHLAGQDRVAFGAGMTKHSIEQHNIWDEEVHVAGLAQDHEKGMAATSNPVELLGTAKNSEAAIRARGNKLGTAQEKIDVLVNQMKEARYSDAIAAAIYKDDKDSPEYLQDAEMLMHHFGGQIPEDKFSAFDKSIREEKEVKEVMSGAELFIAGDPEAKETSIKAHAAKTYPERPDLQKAMTIEMKARKVAIAADKAAFRKEQNDSVASMFVDGTVDRDKILKTVGDDQDQLKWVRAYDNLRTNPKYRDDLALETKLRSLANTDPTSLTNDMIWDKAGQPGGITPETAQAIQIRRDEELKDSRPKSQKWKTDLKLGHTVIDDFEKIGTLSDDPKENAVLYAKARQDLNTAAEAAKAAGLDFDAVEHVQTMLIKPAKENWVWKWIKELVVDRASSFVEGVDAITGVVTDDDAIEFLRANGKMINDKNIADTKNYLENK